MEQQKTSRVLYLDAARCFAVLMVALNHAVNRTWDNYSQVPEEFARIGKLSSLLKAALTVASHLGVPLFLMITPRCCCAGDLRRRKICTAFSGTTGCAC